MDCYVTHVLIDQKDITFIISVPICREFYWITFREHQFDSLQVTNLRMYLVSQVLVVYDMINNRD